MDPTRCEGGCGRWIHHPKRAKVKKRRFCLVCANPRKRLVHPEPPPAKPPSSTPRWRKMRKRFFAKLKRRGLLDTRRP